MADDPRDHLSPDQLLAAQRAEREQALAQLPEAAQAARAIFDAFEGQGFNADQALYLTAVQIISPDFKAP